MIGDDCLAPLDEYDRILMNAPYEKGQDIDHVMHCYRFLADGGRLVALMSAGSMYRSDKKAIAFQEFLQQSGATVEKLDQQDYGKDHGRVTGFSTVLVTIDK